MERRFGDKASIAYFDISNEAVRRDHAKTIESIDEQGLIYPVTFVDGAPLYDGAVSYPAILRAIEGALNEHVG